jgi:hypothetical protein
MQEKVACKNKLSCTNKWQIKDLGKYLNTLYINDLKNKVFVNIHI